MNKLKKYYHKKMECDKIYRRALNGADYGIWEWNMDEFTNNIVYEKDKELAIKDLYEYINGNKLFYQSTFRLKNEDSTWVLIKGRILKGESGCCRLFSEMMSEVNEDKLSKNWNEITNIPNRVFFLKKIDNSLNMDKLHNKRVALIYINIDNFKSLNTIFGYNVEDIILMLFAQSIIRILNKYSELGRIGGSEFAILVHEFNTMKDVEKICNKIHRYFKDPFKIMNYKVYITVTIGVSIFPKHGSDSYELLKYCYFAIDNSKNREKIDIFF